MTGPLREVTAETAHAALVALWESGAPLLSAMGPDVPEAQTRRELAAIRSDVWGRPTPRSI